MKKGMIVILLAVSAMLFTTQAWAVSEDGLVLHYRFNGNLSDASGNGNHGSHGDPISTIPEFEANWKDLYFHEGIEGEGFLFAEGQPYYIYADHSPELALDQWTISMWVKPKSFWADAYLISKQKYVQYNFAVDLSAEGIVRFFYTDQEGENFTLETDNPIPLDQWTHIAVTRDVPGKVRIYINGEIAAQADTSPPPVLVEGILAVGGPEYGPGLDGLMDELRIYWDGLPQEKIEALYADHGEANLPPGEEPPCEEIMPEFFAQDGKFRMKAPVISYTTFDGKTSHYKMELEYSGDMTWTIKHISAVDK